MSCQVRQLVELLFTVVVRTSLGAFQRVLLGLQLGLDETKAVHSSRYGQPILS